jgi:hypothetical protein
MENWAVEKRPYLKVEVGPFVFIPKMPACCGLNGDRLPTGRQGATGRGGKYKKSKSLCFEDENDLQPDPVFNNLRILHCHPHFSNPQTGDTS